jgi:hypothetical protein
LPRAGSRRCYQMVGSGSILVRLKVCSHQGRGPSLPSFVRDAGRIARPSSEAARVDRACRLEPAVWSRTSLHPSPYAPQPRSHTGPYLCDSTVRQFGADIDIVAVFIPTNAYGITTDPAGCRSTFFYAHLQSPTTPPLVHHAAPAETHHHWRATTSSISQSCNIALRNHQLDSGPA